MIRETEFLIIFMQAGLPQDVAAHIYEEYCWLYENKFSDLELRLQAQQGMTMEEMIAEM